MNTHNYEVKIIPPLTDTPEEFERWLDSEEGHQWERDIDWDAYEERKRQRIAESQEY